MSPNTLNKNTTADSAPLIQIRDLKKYFQVNEGVIVQKTVAEVKAIDGVSFDIRKEKLWV